MNKLVALLPVFCCDYETLPLSTPGERAYGKLREKLWDRCKYSGLAKNNTSSFAPTMHGKPQAFSQVIQPEQFRILLLGKPMVDLYPQSTRPIMITIT